MLSPAARRDLRKSLDTPVGAEAFACFREKPCPESAKCPMWQTISLDDPVEGREDFTGCGFKLLPTYFHLGMGFSIGAMQTSEASAKKVERAVGMAVETARQLEASREQRQLKVIEG